MYQCHGHISRKLKDHEFIGEKLSLAIQKVIDGFFRNSWAHPRLTAAMKMLLSMRNLELLAGKPVALLLDSLAQVHQDQSISRLLLRP
ncbi:MAG TPA: hypothetical protein PK918_01880 [Methanotrichaceae archaeon]|nr:hypothetical protein [Methanotrichaceae archaeon]